MLYKLDNRTFVTILIKINTEIKTIFFVFGYPNERNIEMWAVMRGELD